MNKFNKLYNVIMEDLEAEYMDADFSEPFDLEGFKKRQAEWHKPKEDITTLTGTPAPVGFVFDETCDGWDAVYEEFCASLEFDIQNSEYTQQIVEELGENYYDYAETKFDSFIDDPTIKPLLQNYVNDPNGETDAWSKLEDEMHYWIVDNCMVDLETDAVSSEDEEQMFAIDTDLFRKFKDIYKQWDPASFDNMTEQDFLDDYKEMLKAGYTPKQIANFTNKDLDKWYFSNEDV